MDRPPVIFAVFQTASKSNGGVASIAEVIARVSRVRPVIVTQRETAMTDRWRSAGHEVHVWPAPGAMAGEAHHGEAQRPGWRRIPDMLAYNRRLARLARETGAVAVHANDPAAFWHVALGAKLSGRRLVMNIRDTFERPLSGARLAKWRLIHGLADEVIVLSRDMAQRWRRLLRLNDTGKFRVAYSLVDADRFKPVTAAARASLRTALGVQPDETLLVYVAAFNPKKAQADFLRGAARALRAEPKVRLVFVGDFDPAVNAYAAECAAVVEAEGLGAQVRFAGAAERIEDWYGAADAVVLASRYEGLARCMIEAMAMGVPVASFEVSSAREMLEETGAGVVAPQGDYEGLIAGALALARRPRGKGTPLAAKDSVAVYEHAWLGS